MIKPIQQVLTTARNTFIESIRQPVVTVLLILGILGLAMNLNAAYSMDQDDKLMIEMGFSTLFLIGLFMAAFTATGVLSQEIENKTVLTVVSKPVPRPVFVLGKYVGVMAAIGINYWTLAMIMMFFARMGVAQDASYVVDGPAVTLGLLAVAVALGVALVGNYFYHWVFTSSFIRLIAVTMTVAYFFTLWVDRNWMFQHPLTHLSGQFIAGLVLIFFGLMVMTSIAIAASTRLGQVMTLVICCVMFLLGILSDFLFGRIAETSQLAAFLYRIIPNVQYFMTADAITQDFPISASYVGLTLLYALGFVAAILCLAVALFQTREVG